MAASEEPLKTFVRILLCLAVVLPAGFIAGRNAPPVVAAPVDVAGAGQDPISVMPEATAASYPPGSYRDGEVVVQLRPGDVVEALTGLLARFDFLADGLDQLLTRVSALGDGLATSLGPFLKLDLRAGEGVLEAVSALRASGLVAQAEPNIIFHASVVPNDPYYQPRPLQNYEGQWNLWKTNADHAWDVTEGDANLAIAVLDTGVDYNNPDLAARCVSGYNFVANNRDPMDDNFDSYHGTSIAGIAACSTGNNILLAGMTWYGRIMPVKVLGADGSGNLGDIINGVLYAANYFPSLPNSQGRAVDFINMSIESNVYSGTLQSAINYAHGAGVFIAAAAGNVPGMIYPGAMDHVVSVAATDQNDIRADFSNHNKMVDIAAPGIAIPGPLRGTTTNFSIASGTSEATPQVVGAALLVKSKHPGFTPDQIELRLEATALDLGPPGRDPFYGWGRLDVQAAVVGIGATITSPAGYSFPSSGYVQANGSEDGGNAISQLQLLVDGVQVDSASVNPATFTGYPLANMPEGAHYIQVRAIDTVGAQGYGSTWLYRNAVTPAASNEWYLAEGTTAHGFETWILVENSNPTTVSLNCTYMTPAGPHNRALATIPANTRYTINVNAEMPGTDVSAYLWASQPVTAERAMYWNSRAAGHDSIGANSPSSSWYLAEGTTASGFDTYILVQNPNPGSISVQLDFMKSDGSDVPFVFPMAGQSRITVRAGDIVPNADISTRVTSTGGDVVAERAMYWNNFGGGHESVGATAPSVTWYLAEGTTANGFEEYLLIQNPDASRTAHANLYFLKPNGDMEMLAASLPPNSRTTVQVSDVVGATDVSTTVMSDIPVVAERSMYWSNRLEGHNSIGCTTPDENWYLAEGSTLGFEEYVLLANPTDSPAHVTLTFMRNDGTTATLAATLAALSRVTVRANDVTPNTEVSVRVASSDRPIMVERAMYWNNRRGGTDSIGAR